jgi:hypothetical protein
LLDIKVVGKCKGEENGEGGVLNVRTKTEE